MNKNNFDIEKIVDFNIDYYAILGVDRNSFPQGNTTEDKKKIDEILALAYRKNAKNCHPDSSDGSPEKFKLLLRSHTVLSDQILRRYYDSKGQYKPTTAGDGTIQVDWSTLGSFRPNSMQDTLGFSLFFQITQKREILKIIPAFRPKDEFDNYEWDWVINDMEAEDGRQFKLALSLVHDENEVLRLTSGDKVEESLPFKIYLCIPRASLYFLRGQEQKILYEDNTYDVLSGELQAASYSDYELLETTNLKEAQDYIDNELENYLIKFRSGKITEEKQKKDIEMNQSTWVSEKKMKELDIDVLKAIMRMKTFRGVKDDTADEFLNDIVKK
jgi:hypothetical protein